jgi:sugar phosphate isomerase/epimerase
VRLCVEHIPGRALPTAAGTLAWLERSGHEQLGLLLDIGHSLITREDSAEVVRRAGPRLGYVHFDDNDGVADCHWPLLTGRLTEETLREVGLALREINYRGALCLELNPENPLPVEALRQGKELIERALSTVTK